MRISRGTLLLAAAVPALSGSAPDDFAFGRRIEVDAAAPVYELEIPEAVYRGVTRGDLADVRVFNSAGEPVAHVLRAPEAAAETTRVELPVFPLRAARGQAPAGSRAEVETRIDGAVVRVRGAAARPERLGGYLLDASRLERPIGALHLRLADSAEVVARVRVEGSADLDRWHTLVTGSTVARLAYDGDHLTRSTIELPGVHDRYLRLRWDDGEDALPLLGVQAQLQPTAVETARRWSVVAGEPAGDTAGVFTYDAHGHFPVDRVALELPANLVVSAVVSSRPSTDAPWRARQRGLHYHLRVEDAELVAEPAALPTTTDRYWRVQIVAPSPVRTAPALRLGWRPQRLAFLATGEPPFLLAWGSAAADSAGAPLSWALDNLGTAGDAARARPARLGAEVTLGGETRLLARPAPVDWRRLLLWGVLLAGVAALAAIAWRLRREPDPS